MSETDEPWTPGVWVEGDFSLSEDQVEEVRRALPADPADDVIERVQSALQTYLSMEENRNARPGQGKEEDLGEIERLADAARQLHRAIRELGPSARERVVDLWMAELADPERPLPPLDAAQRLSFDLYLAADAFHPSREPETHRLLLVRQLAEVWQSAVGEWPTRRYRHASADGSREAGESGEFRGFVLSCLRMVDPDPDPPDSYIKAVCGLDRRVREEKAADNGA